MNTDSYPWLQLLARTDRVIIRWKTWETKYLFDTLRYVKQDSKYFIFIDEYRCEREVAHYIFYESIWKDDILCYNDINDGMSITYEFLDVDGKRITI